jgi:hypothetical protein
MIELMQDNVNTSALVKLLLKSGKSFSRYHEHKLDQSGARLAH